mmetsp:Transcript_18805/g.18920  ORF Transcript_18805/g.18920 Transcript_18805/m.18920 type:complete len:507 (-) Transcript_18805:155-1675(-)|eukprot:CAMPEP_0182428556 /NCGR_PEP_ID=MMETSP1167-20130531/23106_1 /TAXON_ID=2988 /ORGANISM="Mallomonas Sp, Strain CCMP3275" /LENGTH=506 /DNA_ID=CAMNT_0024611519 /DNA_START=48 /DNA_END=1568 /DNA_ORIENTATION=+
MSETLKKFLEESENVVAEDEISSTAEEQTNSKIVESKETNESKSGKLLITACIDWENATSKKGKGLDVPHTINLSLPVSKVFSSSSSLHFFILLSDGKSLLGMGKNDHGQLGIRNNSNQFWPVPVSIPSESPVSKIATGKSHSIVLLENKEIYVCGANNFGQIGMGEGARGVVDCQSFTKLGLNDVRDIACGYDHSLVCNHSGDLFAFGHPDYGQLGFGSTGQYIRDGGKGAAIQFHCVSKPQKVTSFFSKDGPRKSSIEIPRGTVRVAAVAAGKNHSLCVEEWENEAPNRVFSWGFGGYGRLGHNSSDDELYPTEIAIFSQQKKAPFKQIREVYGGASFSLVISVSRHVYFFGKLPNSPRGEATIYPKIQQELYDWSVHSAAAGSTFVAVAAANEVVVWGAPVAGKFGVEGGGKNVSNPNFVQSVKDLRTLQVSAGYGHICMVVSDDTDEARARLSEMPELTKEMSYAMAGSDGADDNSQKEETGKKRARPGAGAKKGTASKKKK